ncbi:STAS/SEC14 domain-containing protein [Jhaorihella thermophila]
MSSPSRPRAGSRPTITKNTLIPEIEARISKEGKVNLLYVLGPDFEGFSAGAAWEDAELGLRHIGDFARVAVVSDKAWVRGAVRMFAPLVGAEVQAFRMEELDKAKEWITRYRPRVRTRTGGRGRIQDPAARG